MDELDELERDLEYDDETRLYIKYLISLVRMSEMPDAYIRACARWLRSCKQEACKAQHGGNRNFVMAHLQRELEKFATWVIPTITTQKMAALQESVVLFDYSVYGADTDKTVGMQKIV